MPWTSIEVDGTPIDAGASIVGPALVVFKGEGMSVGSFDFGRRDKEGFVKYVPVSSSDKELTFILLEEGLYTASAQGDIINYILVTKVNLPEREWYRVSCALIKNAHPEQSPTDYLATELRVLNYNKKTSAVYPYFRLGLFTKKGISVAKERFHFENAEQGYYAWWKSDVQHDISFFAFKPIDEAKPCLVFVDNSLVLVANYN